MNYIAVNTVSDFESILDSEIVLMGDKEQETSENMWSITLSEELEKTITQQQITHLIEKVIEKTKQISTQLERPITFYLWYEEQVASLRFNIISGHHRRLPFGCKINLVHSINEIIIKFLNLGGTGQIFYDQVDFDCDIACENDFENYVLDVYVFFVNPNL